MCPPDPSKNAASGSTVPVSSTLNPSVTLSTAPPPVVSPAPVRLGYEPPPIDWIYEPAPVGRWITLRTAFDLCAAEHVAVLILILLIPLGSGREVFVCGLCSLGFWVGAIGILIERPRRLTASDLAYVVSAFPLALILGHLFVGCLL